MRILTWLVILFIGTLVATAGIAPTLDVTALTREAEVIVVGQALSIREIGPAQIDIGGTPVSARMMVCNLRVDRVVKGRASRNLFVLFPITDAFVGYRGVSPRQYGVFFLRPDRDRFRFASPYYPFVVATRTGHLGIGDDLARVTAELDSVTRSPSSTTRERALAMLALATVKTERAAVALRHGAQTLTQPLNIYAATILADRNDISYLKLVADYLHNSSRLVIEDGGFRIDANPARALENVADARAIPALKQLIYATDPITRQCAARALGNTKAREAIPSLASALEDSDREVRWLSVVGLSKISGEKWISIGTFASNEQRILTHWRQWVSNQR